MNIVLLGYMGSGKSSIGSCVANLLNREFIDLDVRIEQHLGMPISEIFNHKGAVYFRKQESKILDEVLNAKNSCVIALGGGTPIYGSNLKSINNPDKNFSIYLKMGVEPLVRRLWLAREQRPLIAEIKTPELLEEFVRKHLFERTHVYQQAHGQIEVSNLDLHSAAQGVIELFKAR